MEEVEVKTTKGRKKVETEETAMNLNATANEVFNPLRKEIVLVKFIPRQGKIMDKKHLMYGGMMDGAVKGFSVPILESTGNYVNVLTDNEKKFFEETLGLESNALSIYKKENNLFPKYKKYH